MNGLSGLMGQGYNAAGGLSALYSDRASAVLGNGANRANVRTGGLSAITGANTALGQAQAGGVLGAAAARAAGAQNIANIGGEIFKVLAGGGGGAGSAGYVGAGGIPIPGSNPFIG
jgi:hypothetical protein